MDKASDFGSEDCEFESRRGRPFLSTLAVSVSVVVEIYPLTYSRRFCGVVVITSALHAEGREFEPRQNLSFLRHA